MKLMSEMLKDNSDFMNFMTNIPQNKSRVLSGGRTYSYSSKQLLRHHERQLQDGSVSTLMIQAETRTNNCGLRFNAQNSPECLGQNIHRCQ